MKTARSHVAIDKLRWCQYVGITTTRPSTAWQPPPPAHSAVNASLPALISPLPFSTLCHLVTPVPPLSPSPSSRAALGTKGILRSAGVWKTPGAGLFHKGIYILWVRCFVSRMQLGNIRPPPRWGRWDIFSRMSQWSLRSCISHMEHEHVRLSSCSWMISPLPPYCNSNDLQSIFTLKFKPLRLHRWNR